MKDPKVLDPVPRSIDPLSTVPTDKWDIADMKQHQPAPDTTNGAPRSTLAGYPPDKLLTATELGNLWAVHRTTVYRLMYDHGLPSITLGRARRFRVSDVAAWLDQRVEN